MINITLLVIYLIIAPLIVGASMFKILEKGNKIDLVSSYIWGHITMWVIFWLLCVPAAILHIKFSFIVAIFNIIILIMVLYGIKKYGKKLCEIFAILHKELFKLNMVEWLIIVLVIIQIIVFIFLKTAMDGDDATYIALSLDTVSNNEIAMVKPYTGMPGNNSLKLILTSWNFFISYLSYISGVHVAVVAHTVLPIILVPMAYMVFGILGQIIYNGDRRKASYFLLGMNLFVLLGGYSIYTYTFRLLVCIWQGKAVMAVIVLPFFLCFLMKNNTYGKKEIVFTLIIMIAACSMSLMGVGLSVLVLGIFLLTNYKKGEWGKYKYLILPGLIICGIAVFYLYKSSYWKRLAVERIPELYPKAVSMLTGACTLYWNKSLMLCIYVISMVYLVKNCKKNVYFEFLTKYILGFYLIIFNPVFYYIAFIFCKGAAVYVRMFYVAFPEICMSVIFSQVISDILNKKKRIFGICLLSIITVLVGENFASIGRFERAENVYKLPQEVIDLCDMINENSGGESPYIMASHPGIVNYVRQYSSQIKMLYGREGYYYNGQQIFELINQKEVSEEEIWELMKENGCNYLIWGNFTDNIEQFENCGATVVGNTENYVVLRR